MSLHMSLSPAVSVLNNTGLIGGLVVAVVILVLVAILLLILAICIMVLVWKRCRNMSESLLSCSGIGKVTVWNGIQAVMQYYNVCVTYISAMIRDS